VLMMSPRILCMRMADAACFLIDNQVTVPCLGSLARIQLWCISMLAKALFVSQAVRCFICGVLVVCEIRTCVYVQPTNGPGIVTIGFYHMLSIH
jgi:hypothetical protein